MFRLALRKRADMSFPRQVLVSIWIEVIKPAMTYQFLSHDRAPLPPCGEGNSACSGGRQMGQKANPATCNNRRGARKNPTIPKTCSVHACSSRGRALRGLAPPKGAGRGARAMVHGQIRPGPAVTVETLFIKMAPECESVNIMPVAPQAISVTRSVPSTAKAEIQGRNRVC